MIQPDTEYREFTEKFEPKKTTDDCYTPKLVYDAVAEWVQREYGADRAGFIRPFWPGADYKTVDVPEGCCVVDNPPFSIIAQIVRHYIRAGVRFFLFAPTLTLFSGQERTACYIPCGVSITYENGAQVNTSFVTNMDECQLRSAPDLFQAVKAANDENRRKDVKELPKYSYPDCVLTAAAAYQYSRLDIDYRVKADECTFIRALDAQRQVGKAIFGSGLLLGDRAAADRAAADRAAADRAAAEKVETQLTHVWELSEREKAIVATLSGGGRQCSVWIIGWIIKDGDGAMMEPGLYLMDCMEAMKEFPDGFFDLAIVDPPYGGGYKEDETTALRGGGTELGAAEEGTVRRDIPEISHRSGLRGGGAKWSGPRGRFGGKSSVFGKYYIGPAQPCGGGGHRLAA